MHIVYKKKIYNGLVELRDYERDKFVKLGKPVKIIVGDKFMILSLADLKKGRITNTQHSIINEGQTYKLVGWRWQPTGMIDEQLDITQGLTQMAGTKGWKELGVKLHAK